MLVCDASVVVEVILDRGAPAEWATERLRDARVPHAPGLVDYEVVSALRRLVAAGTVPVERASSALASFGRMPLRRHAALPYLSRMLSLRSTLTAYDAAYVVLAEELQCPLLTFDRRLARSHGHRATVLVPPAAAG